MSSPVRVKRIELIDQWRALRPKVQPSGMRPSKNTAALPAIQVIPAAFLTALDAFVLL
jgi:hypothetical protein